MKVETLEKRLSALEAEVARLRNAVEGEPRDNRPWWEQIFGTFADDPLFEEAMRLGREYRESLRPSDTEIGDDSDVSA